MELYLYFCHNSLKLYEGKNCSVLMYDLYLFKISRELFSTRFCFFEILKIIKKT